MKEIKYRIIIDTREKEIDHIEKAFKKNNIDYIRRALPIGNYRSNMNPKAARGMILSLEAKYPNLTIVWMSKKEVASYINSILYYSLREDLKEK